jgi:hypothetical protein
MSSSRTSNPFVDLEADVSDASDNEILLDDMKRDFLAEDCQEDAEEVAVGDDVNEDREFGDDGLEMGSSRMGFEADILGTYPFTPCI